MMACSEIHEFTSKLSPLLKQPTNVTIANALIIGSPPLITLDTLTEHGSIPARVTLDESVLCSASSRRQAERLTVCSNSIRNPTGLILTGRENYQTLDEYENVVRTRDSGQGGCSIAKARGMANYLKNWCHTEVRKLGSRWTELKY